MSCRTNSIQCRAAARLLQRASTGCARDPVLLGASPPLPEPPWASRPCGSRPVAHNLQVGVRTIEQYKSATIGKRPVPLRIYVAFRFKCAFAGGGSACGAPRAHRHAKVGFDMSMSRLAGPSLLRVDARTRAATPWACATRWGHLLRSVRAGGFGLCRRAPVGVLRTRAWDGRRSGVLRPLLNGLAAGEPGKPVERSAVACSSVPGSRRT